jgi:hypothetical protein
MRYRLARLDDSLLQAVVAAVLNVREAVAEVPVASCCGRDAA